MSKERSKLSLDDDSDILANWKPKPVVKSDTVATASLAQSQGFVSRQAPVQSRVGEVRHDRRYRTGRNAQLNLKVTIEARDRFLDLCDRYGWVQGEGFEKAVNALIDQMEGS
ncbi:stability/partitioning determinant [Brucella sp. 22210]|uniref:stability/partitioning determinant n=1 Tax=Brucella sp. 22210 TaxID=3453892 RepID=UPI003F85A54C